MHNLGNCAQLRDYIMNLSSQWLENDKPVSKILKDIFSKMRTNPHVTNPDLTNTYELRRLFSTFNDGMQHDLFQYFEEIIHKLAAEEDSETVKALLDEGNKDVSQNEDAVYERAVMGSAIYKLFTWLTEEKFHCEYEDCKKPNYSIFSTSLFLQIGFRNFKDGDVLPDLQGCISKSLENPFDPKNIKKCANCGRDIKQGTTVIIKRAPPIAMIMIGRAVLQGKKADIPIETKEYISLGNESFKIKCTANHIGTYTHFGHYNSLIRNGKDWILANDRDVLKASLAQRNHSRKDTYCMIYLKQNASPLTRESERLREDSVSAASVIETVVVEDIENTQPGPPTDNISSDKGNNISSLLLSIGLIQ